MISVFSRILERVVHDQLYEFLKANKVITRNQSAFQKLYSTVTSLICNTDSWYENIHHKKIETLQRLQNRAQLIIETARVKDKWSSDWLNVSNLISFDRLVKIINKLRPESLWDKFELRSVHSKYEISNCHDLQIRRLHTERARISFQYSTLKLWNDMPVDIRDASTLKCFKKKLKAHLLADQNNN